MLIIQGYYEKVVKSMTIGDIKENLKWYDYMCRLVEVSW